MEVSLCLGRFPTKTEVSAIDVSATTKKRQGATLLAVEVSGVMMYALPYSVTTVSTGSSVGGLCVGF